MYFFLFCIIKFNPGNQASPSMAPMDDERIPEIIGIVSKLESEASRAQTDMQGQYSTLLSVLKKTIDMVRDENKRGTKDLWGKFAQLSSETQAAIGSVQVLVQRGEQVQRTTVDALTKHHQQSDETLRETQARINAELDGKLERLAGALRDEQLARERKERDMSKQSERIVHAFENKIGGGAIDSGSVRNELTRAIRDVQSAFQKSENNFASNLDTVVGNMNARHDSLQIMCDRNVRECSEIVSKLDEKNVELEARDQDLDQRFRSMIYNSEEKFLRHAEQTSFDMRAMINQKFTSSTKRFDGQFKNLDDKNNEDKKLLEKWKNSLQDQIAQNLRQGGQDASAARDTLRLEVLDVVTTSGDAQDARLQAITKDLDAARDELLMRISNEESRREHDVMAERKRTDHACKRISDTIAETTKVISEIDDKHDEQRDILHDKIMAKVNAEILQMHGQVTNEMLTRVEKEAAARIALDTERLKLMQTRFEALAEKVDEELKQAKDTYMLQLLEHRSKMDIRWGEKEIFLDKKLKTWEEELQTEFECVRNEAADSEQKVADLCNGVQSNLDKESASLFRAFTKAKIDCLSATEKVKEEAAKRSDDLEEQLTKLCTDRFDDVTEKCQALNESLDLTKEHLETARMSMEENVTRIDGTADLDREVIEVARQKLQDDMNEKIDNANARLDECKKFSDEIQAALDEAKTDTNDRFQKGIDSINQVEESANLQIKNIQKDTENAIKAMDDRNQEVKRKVDEEQTAAIKALTADTSAMQGRLETATANARCTNDAMKDDMRDFRNNMSSVTNGLAPVLEKVENAMRSLMETAKNEESLEKLNTEVVELRDAYSKMRDDMNDAEAAAKERHQTEKERIEAEDVAREQEHMIREEQKQRDFEAAQAREEADRLRREEEAARLALAQEDKEQALVRIAELEAEREEAKKIQADTMQMATETMEQLEKLKYESEKQKAELEEKVEKLSDKALEKEGSYGSKKSSGSKQGDKKKVEEKFRKYFGYLARCEGNFCTTTLKI